MKPHTSASQRLVLLLCGFFVALTFLEIGLRAGGRAFLWMQERRNRASLREGRPFRILCIGESTTALGGEDAYPQQLERVLNEQAGRPLVSVINRGVRPLTRPRSSPACPRCSSSTGRTPSAP